MTIPSSPSTNRLHGLDHLRATAILLVMVFHYGRGAPTWLEPIRNIGWSGVDLFFVLSGYLIGYQLLKEYKTTENLNFKNFYLKRFFRIIPAYVAVLLVYFYLPIPKEGSGLPPMWRFLTFTQNFGLDTQTQKSFSHAWSLCIEEQFYLILPITIVVIFKSKIQKIAPYLIVGIIIIGFILRTYYWNHHVQPFIDAGNRRQMMTGFLEKVYYPSYNRMDGLTIGIAIAAIFNFKPKAKEFFTKKGNLVLLVGLVLLFFAFKVSGNFISQNTVIWGFPFVSLAFGVIVIAAISPTCILYNLKSNFTFIVATLSYVVYLSHKEVFFLIQNWIIDIDNEKITHLAFWISLVASFIVGLIMHFCIEKPFMRFRKRIIRRD